MHTQELIALGVVAVAVVYLLWRALRKGKPGCGCGECGCSMKSKLPGQGTR